MGSELPHEWDKNIQLYYIEVKFFFKKTLRQKPDPNRQELSDPVTKTC